MSNQYLDVKTKVTQPIPAFEIISLYNLREKSVKNKVVKQQIKELISSIEKKINVDNDFVVSVIINLTESKSYLLFFTDDFELFLGAIGPSNNNKLDN